MFSMQTTPEEKRKELENYFRKRFGKTYQNFTEFT